MESSEIYMTDCYPFHVSNIKFLRSNINAGKYLFVIMNKKNFICNNCNKDLKNNINYKKHLKRKTQCIDVMQEMINKDELICNYCDKTFNSYNSLYKHSKYSKCRDKNRDKILNTQKLLKSKNSNNICGNKNATNSPNSLNTITNNYIVKVDHGKENLNRIPPSESVRIITSQDPIQEFVKYVHCNEEKPEWMNVYYPSVHSKYMYVCVDSKWLAKEKNIFHNGIFYTWIGWGNRIWSDEKIINKLKNDEDVIKLGSLLSFNSTFIGLFNLARFGSERNKSKEKHKIEEVLHNINPVVKKDFNFWKKGGKINSITVDNINDGEEDYSNIYNPDDIKEITKRIEKVKENKKSSNDLFSYDVKKRKKSKKVVICDSDYLTDVSDYNYSDCLEQRYDECMSFNPAIRFVDDVYKYNSYQRVKMPTCVGKITHKTPFPYPINPPIEYQSDKDTCSTFSHSDSESE
jgi:hypothetical protein